MLLHLLKTCPLCQQEVAEDHPSLSTIRLIVGRHLVDVHGAK